MIVHKLSILLSITLCSALDLPERYAKDESVVSAINQYAQSLHSIVGCNTSLGVTMKNGAKVLFFDDVNHNRDKTTVVVNVGVGTFNMDNGYGEVAHIVEHEIVGQRSMKFNGSLLSFVLMSGGNLDAETHLENTRYEFTVETNIVRPTFDRLTQNLFGEEIKEDAVKYHFKMIADEYVHTKRGLELDDMWLYDGVNFLYQPLYRQLPFKRGIKMEDLIMHVRSAHKEYLRAKSICLIVRGKNATSAENVAYFLGKVGGMESKANNASKQNVRADMSIEMPHVFIRVISNHTQKITISINFPYDKQYVEYKFAEWLSYALRHSGFEKDVQEMGLMAGRAQLFFQIMTSPMFVFKAKTHFPLLIQFKLTKNGVFQHKRVLQHLADHLMRIHNYSESDWVEVRSKYTTLGQRKFSRDLAERVRNYDLENSIVKAIKPQFNLDFQRSGIEFLIQNNYSYILRGPIPRDANISSFTILPIISYKIEPSFWPTMESVQLSIKYVNQNLNDTKPEIIDKRRKRSSTFKRASPLEKTPRRHEKPGLRFHDIILRVWQKDVARANARVHLNLETSGTNFSTMENCVLRDIYLHFIQDSSRKIEKTTNGFMVEQQRLKPFRFQFQSLLNRLIIIDEINDHDVKVACNRLMAIPSTNSADLRNKLPELVCHQKTHALGEEDRWKCENIGIRNLTQFLQQFYSQLHADIYVINDMKNPMNVLHFSEEFHKAIVKRFDSKPITRLDPNQDVINESKTTFINVTAPGEIQNMAEINFFIPRTDKLAVVALGILYRIQRDLVLHKLRIVDGLGYDPTVNYIPKHEGIIQRFLVWGIAHSPLQMERKIDELIHSFKYLIEELPQHIFEAGKKFKNLFIYSRENTNWYHITKHDDSFDEGEDVQQLSDALTRQNIWTSLQKYFDPSSVHMKRTIIHVHAEYQHVDREMLRQLVEQ